MPSIRELIQFPVDWFQQDKYGDFVHIYLHCSWVSDITPAKTDIDYVLAIGKQLEPMLKAYNARLADIFINTKFYRNMTQPMIDLYAILSGNPEVEAIVEMKSKDLYFPDCRLAYAIIDWMGSQSSRWLARNYEGDSLQKITVLNQGIVFAGYPPPGMGGPVMTHGNAIVIWMGSMATEVAKPENMAKLLLHEIMHAFGATHESSTSQKEYGTVLGNYPNEPHIITKRNADEVTQNGLVITNKVKVK